MDIQKQVQWERRFRNREVFKSKMIDPYVNELKPNEKNHFIAIKKNFKWIVRLSKISLNSIRSPAKLVRWYSSNPLQSLSRANDQLIKTNSVQGNNFMIFGSSLGFPIQTDRERRKIMILAAKSIRYYPKIKGILLSPT